MPRERIKFICHLYARFILTNYAIKYGYSVNTVSITLAAEIT